MANVDELRRLSGLLDQALDLPVPEREAWLATLRGEAAASAPRLRDLLARAASKETAELLDGGPSFALPGEAGPATSFSEGDAVGPYRLLRAIGQGGMGEVWLAERRDGQLRRSVALKLPTLGLRRSVLVQRFARERDILGGLVHPHIARLYDAGLADDGQPYLALEHVDGQPITAFCDAHALGLRRRVELLQQVMGAVQYAHANLVIHRDLKPSNVLVTAQGQAMLLDFGIAKLLQGDETQAAETELTQLGGRALTLDYAAPEQVGGAPISIATDVWALGALLYELLTAQRPFKGTRHELEQAIMTQEPARPTGLPADLSTIVLKALKKPPGERYATVDAFAADLGRWLRGEPVLAQPDSAWYRARKFVGRNKSMVATVAGVLATVVMASAVALWQARLAREQTRVAQTEARTAAAVQDFLENIFRANSGGQVDPIKARQRTAKELLDEGMNRVERDLQSEPQAKLRVLDTLAAMYADMGQMETEARLHARRADLALQLEGPGGRTRILALASQVRALSATDQLQDAKRVLEVAERALSPTSDAKARARVLLAKAHLAQRIDPAAGVDAVIEATALIREQGDQIELAESLELQGILLLYGGRPADAVASLREALAITQAAGVVASINLPSLLSNLGQAYRRLGRTTEAEAALRDGVAAANKQGDGSVEMLLARANLAQLLDAEGRWREAAEESVLTLQIAHRLPGPADRDAFTASAAIAAALPHIRLGQLVTAEALLDEAQRTSRHHPPGPTLIVAGAVALAELRFERGSDEDAARALDRLRTLASSTPGDQPGYLINEALLRAWFELRRRRPQAVIDAVERGLALSAHAKAGQATAIQTDSLRCLRQSAENNLVHARDSCSTAFRAIAEARGVGKFSMLAVRLRWALGRALIDGGQPAAAKPFLEDAVRMLDAAGDPERSTALIDPLLALAEALQAMGDEPAASSSRARARRIAATQPLLASRYREELRKWPGGKLHRAG